MTWLEKRLWSVRSALHTLVMCRSKIIRRLTSKPPYRSYLLRYEWSQVPSNLFLYGTQYLASLAMVKKDTYAMAHCPHCLDELIPLISSFLCCSLHGRFLASWNIMVRNRNRPNVYAELHCLAFPGKYGTLFSVNVLIAKN